MPIYDCGDPECTECQRAFGPDRSEAISRWHRRNRAYSTPTPSDDFCIIHGRDYMRDEPGNPIAFCAKCRDEKCAEEDAVLAATASSKDIREMPKFKKTYCSHCGGEFGPGDSGYSHCDRHPDPARERLVAAVDLLLQAAKTHLMWIDREREGPLYPAGMKRDDPGGEKVWREWWEDQLDLCARTESQCREAVAAATGELAST